jgi:hypothetical protein
MLDEEAADGVAEARKDDREAAEQLVARAAEVHAEQQRDPDHAEQDTSEPRALRALLVVDPDRQQRGEERCRGDQDPGERGGDLFLAGGDQQKRAGDLNGPEERQHRGAFAHPAEGSTRRG